ncbi:MAG: RIP metalloprotease RseP [Desulfatitalea sp.]|nr:RIP metalloprotease RseP [Desulfatitalea sp.]NNK02313.1 RIP metalloprotease RseP [Desulfatitalea sp.]
MIDTIFHFIIVLGVLIFFHELGHFVVARLFGVGVERFSLGFGPRIFGKTMGRTDYRLSLIPLGGYVKMMGEEPDAPIPPEDLPLSFTHKPVGQRALIVAAGPIFNILFAILIFTGGTYITGIANIKPYVRHVEKQSPAQETGMLEGDRIQAINGNPIASWRDINAVLDESQGGPLTIDITRNGSELTYTVRPKQEHAKDVYGDDITYYDIGIQGHRPISAMVAETLPDMPAQKAGIEKGDRIIAIDGSPIDYWEAMQDIVSQSQGKSMTFTIQRGEDVFEVEIKPVEKQEKNALGTQQSVYRIGILRPDFSIPEADKINVPVGLGQAIVLGLDQTWMVIYESGRFFVKLSERKVSTSAIGGPIRIAIMANQQARQGVMQLIYFIGFISVSLAVINLFPIPVLDGGHLLFFAIEAVQRKPVSIRVRETAQQIGMFLLLLLMIFVLYNDIIYTWF